MDGTIHKYTIETQEELEIKQMLNAPNMAIALWEIDQKLRSYIKYHDFEHSETYDMVDKIRENLHEILADNGLTLDNIC